MLSDSVILPNGCIDLGHGATADFLPGERLHLQQGPINLIVKAYGSDSSIDMAYGKAIGKFRYLLTDLVKELKVLRQPVGSGSEEPCGKVAKRMVETVSFYRDAFVTPMAAVAGAVADEVISWVASVEGIEKCFVNNGGDIAVYLSEGQSLDIGVVPSLVKAVPNAKVSLTENMEIGGVATSGWDGNSYSLGIADAVTVLAPNAAIADAAATMIANKVNVEHPNIFRKPAAELDSASDLGERMVTVSIGELSEESRALALEQGADYARSLIDQGIISSALLSLQDSWCIEKNPASTVLLAKPNISDIYGHADIYK